MNYETTTYADDCTATGIAPLPSLSPAQQDAQLTDEQIFEAFKEAFPGHDLHRESIDFARAIERMCRAGAAA